MPEVEVIGPRHHVAGVTVGKCRITLPSVPLVPGFKQREFLERVYQGLETVGGTGIN